MGRGGKVFSMGIPDKHDPREFNHFAQFDENGNLLAMVEVAVTAPEPESTQERIHVDVTDLMPLAAEALPIPDQKLADMLAVKNKIATRLSGARQAIVVKRANG